MAYKITGTSPDGKRVEHPPAGSPTEEPSAEAAFTTAADWLNANYRDVWITTTEGSKIGPEAIKGIHAAIKGGFRA